MVFKGLGVLRDFNVLMFIHFNDILWVFEVLKVFEVLMLFGVLSVFEVFRL